VAPVPKDEDPRQPSAPPSPQKAATPAEGMTREWMETVIDRLVDLVFDWHQVCGTVLGCEYGGKEGGEGGGV